MKTSLTLAAAAVIAASAVAQTTARTNERQIWDGSTEYTSRLNVGGATGFLSQAFPFGAIAGAKTLTYAQYVVQDFDQSTVEPWELRLLRSGPAGQRQPGLCWRDGDLDQQRSGRGHGRRRVDHHAHAARDHAGQPELFQRSPGLRLAVHGGDELDHRRFEHPHVRG
jgi:hypothetical protein